MSKESVSKAVCGILILKKSNYNSHFRALGISSDNDFIFRECNVKMPPVASIFLRSLFNTNRAGRDVNH